MLIWPLCVSTPSGGRGPRPRGRLAAPYGSRGAPADLASRLGKAARSRPRSCLVGLATTTPAARQTITLDPQNQNSSTPAVVLVGGGEAEGPHRLGKGLGGYSWPVGSDSRSGWRCSTAC